MQEKDTFPIYIPKREERIVEAYRAYQDYRAKQNQLKNKGDSENELPKEPALVSIKLNNINKSTQLFILEYTKKLHRRLGIELYIDEAGSEDSQDNNTPIIIRDARETKKAQQDLDLDYAYEIYMIQVAVNFQAATDILRYHHKGNEEERIATISPDKMREIFKKYDNKKDICNLYYAYNQSLADNLAEITEKKIDEIKVQLEEARLFVPLKYKDYDICTISKYENETFYNAHIAFVQPNDRLNNDYEKIKTDNKDDLPEWYNNLPKRLKWLVKENIHSIQNGRIVPTSLIGKYLHAPLRNCFIMSSGTVQKNEDAKDTPQEIEFIPEHRRGHSAALGINNKVIFDDNKEILEQFYGNMTVSYQTLMSPGRPSSYIRKEDKPINDLFKPLNNRDNYPFYERNFPAVGNKKHLNRKTVETNILSIRENLRPSSKLAEIKNFLGLNINEFDGDFRSKFNKAWKEVNNINGDNDKKLKKLYMAAISYQVIRINRAHYEKLTELCGGDIYKKVPIPTALESIHDQPDRCLNWGRNYNLYEAALGGIIEDYMVAINNDNNPSITHTMCKSGKDRTALVLLFDTLFTRYAQLNDKYFPIYGSNNSKKLFEDEVIKFHQLFQQLVNEFEMQFMAGFKGATMGCFGIIKPADKAYPDNFSKQAAKRLFLEPARFRKHIFNEKPIIKAIARFLSCLGLAIVLSAILLGLGHIALLSIFFVKIPKGIYITMSVGGGLAAIIPGCYLGFGQGGFFSVKKCKNEFPRPDNVHSDEEKPLELGLPKN